MNFVNLVSLYSEMVNEVLFVDQCCCSTSVTFLCISGNFGTWGLTFATCDCTLIYLRNKEDHWNAILAGAATGGILSMRSKIY